ncbi:hypothetical protein [Desulfolutivibrio sp.]|uniref:hypothetical protein n=1 Tax=Desulfolutivibrio sp. TaxID=2773296 RepID=UPI002F9687E8
MKRSLLELTKTPRTGGLWDIHAVATAIAEASAAGIPAKPCVGPPDASGRGRHPRRDAGFWSVSSAPFAPVTIS